MVHKYLFDGVWCLLLLLQIAGGLDEASKFIDGLKIPYIAPSLGGCESLVEQPTIISYWWVFIIETEEWLMLLECLRFVGCCGGF